MSRLCATLTACNTLRCMQHFRGDGPTASPLKCCNHSMFSAMSNAMFSVAKHSIATWCNNMRFDLFRLCCRYVSCQRGGEIIFLFFLVNQHQRKLCGLTCKVKFSWTASCYTTLKKYPATMSDSTMTGCSGLMCVPSFLGGQIFQVHDLPRGTWATSRPQSNMATTTVNYAF